MKKALFFTLISFQCVNNDSTDEINSFLSKVTYWKSFEIEFLDSTNNSWVDFSLGDCLIENCYTFKPNGVFVWDNGLLRCIADPIPQTISGFWKINVSNTTRTITIDYKAEITSIIELIDSKLILQSLVSDFRSYSLERHSYRPI